MNSPLLAIILVPLYSIYFMEIATILNIYAKPDVVLDTLESITHYMTDKVLVVVDGGSKVFDNVVLPVPRIRGLPQNRPTPFRNVALGLGNLAEMHPDADWYCYIDYDCLVTSERFKANLKMAEERGVWMLGNDGHIDDKYMPLINSLVGANLDHCNYYLIGACQFFHRNFIKKLLEIDFFDRFLHLTNSLDDTLPGYHGYDLSEHMYPTLCRYFGGNIGVFATWYMGKWHGSHRVFPIRWRPEIDPATENYPEASIMHPLKSYDHPIRAHHRERRQNVIQRSKSSGDCAGSVAWANA